MFIACSSLVAVVAMPAIGFSIKVASAQSEPLVMVISGEKSRSACEVQDRRTNDDNWGAQSLEGPPVACEGGVVYAVITPQSEMVAAVSRAEVAAESAEASDVRVVPVPDDPEAIAATFLEQANAIHESFAGGATTEEVGAVGFMESDALEGSARTRDEPQASILAADCRTGAVGQQRRRDTRFSSKGARTTVIVHVTYKRISCA